MKKLLFSSLLLLLAYSNSQAQLTLTITSSTGAYSLTCGTQLVVLSASSNYSMTVNYTWTNPQLNSINSTSMSAYVPGVYTVTANSGASTLTQTVAIITNTTPPNVSVSMATSTLSCLTPSTVLQGASTNPNATFSWALPNASTSTSSGITASSNTAAPTSTALGNYVLTVTDTINMCTTSTVIAMYQNLYPPKALIASAAPAITCQTGSVVLTNVSSGGITNFPSQQPVIALAWYGPLPQPTTSNTSTYLAYTPGTYTLEVEDLNNGCTSSTIITIQDNRIYPVITTQYVYTLSCPGSIDITPGIVGSTSGLTYTWSVPNGASVSGLNSPTLVTSSAGVYNVAIGNSAGCITTAYFTVWACVGIESYDSPVKALSLYPNPVKNKLYFEGATAAQLDLKLTIINALGQQVYSENYFDATKELDVNFLSAGIYYVKAQSGQQQKTFKLVKE